MQTPMNSDSKLELDTMRDIQLGVKQTCQAAVKLTSATDYTRAHAFCTLSTRRSTTVFDNPASMSLQPSTHDDEDITKVLTESSSSDRHVLGPGAASKSTMSLCLRRACRRYGPT